MTNSARPTSYDTPSAYAGTALRQRAEVAALEEAALSPAEPGALSPEETLRMMRELRVHQIELDLLYDEFRRTQLELDAARVRTFDLFDMAPVGYCTVDEGGLILDANFAAAELLGLARGALVNQNISRFVVDEDQGGDFLLRKLRIDTGQRQSRELRVVRTDGSSLRIHLVACAVRVDNAVPALRVVLIELAERGQAQQAMGG